MRKKNILLSMAFTFGYIFQISCKQEAWFDVKSDSKLTVPASLQDFEYLLNNYLVMNQEAPGLAEVGSDGHYTLTVPTKPTEVNAYTWTNSLPNLVVVDWNNSYKRIFQCNLVLEGLKKINPQNFNEQEQFNRVKGNALFHRAKNYYDLAQVYGQPYKSSSAISDLGIPLKDGIDITEPTRRASVKDTYDKIVSDLVTASEILPNQPQFLSQGSKTSAFGLLARTFLTMQNYDKAAAYADSSLRLNKRLIDFNKISATNQNMGFFNEETIFYAQRTTAWSSTTRAGSVFVEKDLFDLYNNDDLRKTRFFTVSGNNIIFKGHYNNSTAGFLGLATDEQYLIRAECLARTGSYAEAMKILNDLLRTRWRNTVVFPEFSAVNAEDALKQILVERRKELLFRNLRWTDLRRLNLDNRFKVTLTRTIGGQTYTLEPDSYKYTLPIPDDVIASSDIPQSPGWGK